MNIFTLIIHVHVLWHPSKNSLTKSDWVLRKSPTLHFMNESTKVVCSGRYTSRLKIVLEALGPNESEEGDILIRLVTREEHKSTHSIRDFISRPASVKVKCWRISAESIIVCNFMYGPPSLPTAAAAQPSQHWLESHMKCHRRLMGLCSFCLTDLFKTNTNCTGSLFPVHSSHSEGTAMKIMSLQAVNML